jgi:hypothetical protein
MWCHTQTSRKHLIELTFYAVQLHREIRFKHSPVTVAAMRAVAVTVTEKSNLYYGWLPSRLFNDVVSPVEVIYHCIGWTDNSVEVQIAKVLFAVISAVTWRGWLACASVQIRDDYLAFGIDIWHFLSLLLITVFSLQCRTLTPWSCPTLAYIFVHLTFYLLHYHVFYFHCLYKCLKFASYSLCVS